MNINKPFLIVFVDHYGNLLNDKMNYSNDHDDSSVRQKIMNSFFPISLKSDEINEQMEQKKIGEKEWKNIWENDFNNWNANYNEQCKALKTKDEISSEFIHNCLCALFVYEKNGIDHQWIKQFKEKTIKKNNFQCKPVCLIRLPYYVCKSIRDKKKETDSSFFEKRNIWSIVIRQIQRKFCNYSSIQFEILMSEPEGFDYEMNIKSMNDEQYIYYTASLTFSTLGKNYNFINLDSL